MTHRHYRFWMWSMALAPLCAATATASSITTYGSIVLSTLGTEGMSAVTTGAAADVATATGDTGAMGGTNDSAVTKALSPLMSRPKPAGAPGNSRAGQPSAPTAAQGAPDSSPPAISPPAADALMPPADVAMPPDGAPSEEVPPPPIKTSPDDIDIGGVPVSMPPSDDAPPMESAIPGTTGSPAAETVENSPEPATLTLLALAGLGGYWRARRKK